MHQKDYSLIREKIRPLIEKGMNNKAIEKEVGLPAKVLNYHLSVLGISSFFQQKNNAVRSRITELHSKGFTVRLIAEDLNRKTGIIFKLHKKLGLRPNKKPQKLPPAKKIKISLPVATKPIKFIKGIRGKSYIDYLKQEAKRKGLPFKKPNKNGPYGW